MFTHKKFAVFRPRWQLAALSYMVACCYAVGGHLAAAAEPEGVPLNVVGLDNDVALVVGEKKKLEVKLASPKAGAVFEWKILKKNATGSRSDDQLKKEEVPLYLQFPVDLQFPADAKLTPRDDEKGRSWIVENASTNGSCTVEIKGIKSTIGEYSLDVKAYPEGKTYNNGEWQGSNQIKFSVSPTPLGLKSTDESKESLPSKPSLSNENFTLPTGQYTYQVWASKSVGNNADNYQAGTDKSLEIENISIIALDAAVLELRNASNSSNPWMHELTVPLGTNIEIRALPLGDKKATLTIAYGGVQKKIEITVGNLTVEDPNPLTSANNLQAGGTLPLELPTGLPTLTSQVRKLIDSGDFEIRWETNAEAPVVIQGNRVGEKVSLQWGDKVFAQYTDFKPTVIASLWRKTDNTKIADIWKTSVTVQPVSSLSLELSNPGESRAGFRQNAKIVAKNGNTEVPNIPVEVEITSANAHFIVNDQLTTKVSNKKSGDTVQFIPHSTKAEFTLKGGGVTKTDSQPFEKPTIEIKDLGSAILNRLLPGETLALSIETVQPPNARVLWSTTEKDILDYPKTPTKSALITALKPGSATVKAQLVAEDGKPILVDDKPVEVESKVTVRPTIANAVVQGQQSLIVGTTQRVVLRFKDSQGQSVVERQPFTVEVTDPTILEAQPDDSPLDPNANVVRLTGRSVGESDVIVKIEGAVITRFHVEVLQVAGFEPVKVALNLIPEEMASQLFGKEVSKNFYTVKVRIFNNLLESRNQQRLGQSIIAYSSSIETAISLEKMYNVKSKTQPPPYALTPVLGKEGEVKKEQKWYPVKAEEMVSDYPPALANPDNPLPPDFSLSDTSYALRPVSSVVTGQLLRFKLQDVLTTGASLDFPALQWKSSDDEIISVDQWGNGTAKKIGMATVTAVYGGHLYAETVVVSSGVPANPAESKAVSLQRTLPLRIGWWVRFLLPDQKAVGNASASNTRYVWKSTDSDVALLHDQTMGLALGQKPGFATIIVSEGNSQTYAATVMVTAGDGEGAITPSLFREKGNWRYLSHIFRYRPFTYEMMINTFDQREQQSTRSKGFRLLDGLVGLGSFAAAFKGFQGSGTASALNGISGIITPTARSVFPNMSEVQRQNMVTQLMKPIEEIPFGADIERVLFYPKMPFSGLIEGHLVRISRVHTSYFNISVAIIEKRHNSQINNVAETPQAIVLQ